MRFAKQLLGGSEWSPKPRCLKVIMLQAEPKKHRKHDLNPWLFWFETHCDDLAVTPRHSVPWAQWSWKAPPRPGTWSSLPSSKTKHLFVHWKLCSIIHIDVCLPNGWILKTDVVANVRPRFDDSRRRKHDESWFVVLQPYAVRASILAGYPWAHVCSHNLYLRLGHTTQ